MKYILVTGAYGGMGRKTTQALAEKGFTVFALDKKTEDAQKNIIPIQADITDEKSIFRAVQTVKETTDRLFAIVHFAGIYMLDSLAEMESESFERIFRINEHIPERAFFRRELRWCDLQTQGILWMHETKS